MSAPGNVSYDLLDGELNAYPTLKHTTASRAQALPRGDNFPCPINLLLYLSGRASLLNFYAMEIAGLA
jgi:hypothetical protein